MRGNCRELSLYFHFPFCTSKCPYCHFAVVQDSAKWKPRFLRALFLEWKRLRPHMEAATIVSLYFGGGTPTLFPDGICAIIDRARADLVLAPDCEITVEANPESLTLAVGQMFRRAGVNRLSIGIQSFDDKLLKVLGRTHSAQCGINAILVAKHADIPRLTLDLMYDLPYQTEANWETTLATTAELPITHLSLYNLTFEPHTSFQRSYSSLQPHLPSEITSAALFTRARTFFTDLGFEHYELSAFAKEGHRSIHNSGYWSGRSFLGFGPSAFSYMNNKRWRNNTSLLRYIKALEMNNCPIDFEEKLAYPANICERLAIRLRLLKPLNLKQFEAAVGALPLFVYQALDDLHDKGWLNYQDGHVELTANGQLFYDSVATALIAI